MYGANGFEIIAMPCNQFMNQEPGTEAEIKEFAQGYNVQFPMLNKNDVNGPQACELYRFLRCNSSLYDERKRQANVIPWNFAKFLVD